MNFLRPELKNNARLRNELTSSLMNRKRNLKPFGRARLFFGAKVANETPLQEFLVRHSHRTDASKMAFLAAFCFYLGTIGFYLNYKIKIQEPKWVEDYGQDVPAFKKFRLVHNLQYYRALYIHFYRYKVFHYIEEQQIDPLNDNSLSPKSFEVY